MRNLVVFRGDYTEVKWPEAVCKNIHKCIIAPMKEQGILTDIMFCTYPSDMEKLKIYETYFNPVNIHYTKSGQIVNFKESLKLVHRIYQKYDYVIFLRFDIIYKMNINEWNIFTKEGVILPYRENSKLYPTGKFYGDAIIVISKSALLEVAYNLLACNIDTFICLHNISTIIQIKSPDIIIHTIIDGSYQSNTGLRMGDLRLNPIYIQVKYAYVGADKHLYLECLNDVNSTSFTDL